MSSHPHIAWAFAQRGLKSRQKLILVFLALTWVTQATGAAADEMGKLGMTRKTLRKHLDVLIAANLVRQNGEVYRTTYEGAQS